MPRSNARKVEETPDLAVQLFSQVDVPVTNSTTKSSSPVGTSITATNLEIVKPLGEIEAFLESQIRVEQVPLLQQFIDATVNAVKAGNVSAVDEDDWSLDGDQALFMLQYNNLIEAAFASGDTNDLDQLVESDEFKSIFHGMGFDEAYDRYLTMLEEGRA